MFTGRKKTRFLQSGLMVREIAAIQKKLRRVRYGTIQLSTIPDGGHVKMAEKKHAKGRLWASYALSGFVILFMLFDGLAKLFKQESVVESTVSLGFEEHHLLVMAILGLVATLLYAFPRTAILGAILLTGYYGGVIATHIRLDNPLFSHTLFSVYLSLFAWGGLWLRDSRIKRLFFYN